jgi:quinol monooxygenase YgiN
VSDFALFLIDDFGCFSKLSSKLKCKNLSRTKFTKINNNKFPMQYVLIIHEVADYSNWKQVFDDAAEIRKEAGERSYQVLKYQDQPNKIVHFSVWTSIDAAKHFFESPELVQIREEAGVKAPDFIYLDQLESGTL